MQRDDEGKSTEVMNVAAGTAVMADRYRVRVVSGPSAGAELTIDVTMPTRALVGTSAACALVVADPLVSRRHFAIDVHGTRIKLVDLDSTNGTRVNGVPVLEAILEPGARIEVGRSVMQVDVVGRLTEVALPAHSSFGRVLGASTPMRRLYPLCQRLAQSDLHVLIEGETGTGKELLTEALHEASPRRGQPFVVLDCAGSQGTAASAFEQAAGGTLMLDEVAELDDDMQARILSMLDQIDSKRGSSGDVRVIATSRRNLDDQVQSARFREALFFRLAATRIELPPLRDREDDPDLLARAFWRNIAPAGVAYPSDLLKGYEHYKWPGNVRELKNVVARRAALGAFANVAPPAASDAGDTLENIANTDLPFVEARRRVLAEFEKQYLSKVLARYGGNVSRAAAAAGVARRYFQVLNARSKTR